MNADVHQNVKRGNVYLTDAPENMDDKCKNDVSLNSLKTAMEELTKAIASSGLVKNRGVGREKRFKCWLHDTGNHDVSECKKFIDQRNEEKVETLRQHKACFQCLKVGHVSRKLSAI